MESFFITIQLILSLIVFVLLASEIYKDIRGQNQTYPVKALTAILAIIVVILWLVRVLILQGH